MTTIEDSWNEYIKLVYPTGLDSNSTQFIECRRAFYAGHASLFGFLQTISDFPDEIAVGEMRKLRAELNEFKKAVKTGQK